MHPVAIASSRSRGRPAEDKLDRCHELWHQVRPELEARRYRGLTIKGLARACNLSPAGLYHYFSSKEDFVFFPLLEEAEYCERMTAALNALPPDAGVRLRAAVTLAVSAHVDLMLAAELAAEAGRLETYRPFLLEKYDAARGILADMLHCAKPFVPASALGETSDRVIALIAGWYWSGRPGGPEAVIRSIGSEIDALNSTGAELIENSAG
jgi:AcrR family transcriptional regulator